MSDTHVVPSSSLGHGFIPAEFLAEGRDEYYIRNEQSPTESAQWRNLSANELATLVNNGNTAENWDEVLVTDRFAPELVKSCEFYGLVRIGSLDEVYLEHHDLRVPVGLTNSRIIASDFGANVAVHNVRYIAHYIVGDNAILLNIDEMHTTDHAKFGNGIVKEGEPEEVRVWMDVVNETGGRSVMPFDGMTPGDAYLWARYRAEGDLLERLGEITQKQFDPRRGYYGTVGDRCVIKNCRIIKDVKVGPAAYIKGANKLKNLTINSSADEPTQVGEGVEMVNGIIGRGCHIFYGCKAVRFVMCDNSNLKYGARLIHSLLGDNSTISCCEVLNDLIFPAHEQHHNNSFLTASLVMGQSNIAASASIGSNHNSRAADGEIHAGRGFWPGLGVSLKHNCRFASFVLVVKGSYPSELDVQFPFSLVSNDVANDRLVVMPAYWWLYNMFALARNESKFAARDLRARKIQNIEFDPLAPDSVEEMFSAIELLEVAAAKAWRVSRGESIEGTSQGELVAIGRDLLTNSPEKLDDVEILADRVENSSRKVVLLKVPKAWRAYREMLIYYGAKNVLAWLEENDSSTPAATLGELAGQRQRSWVNLGGQLMPTGDLEAVKTDIKERRLDSWSQIHGAWDALWEKYPRQKAQHALATLLALWDAEALDEVLWERVLDEATRITRHIAQEVYATRAKDFESPFRRMVYESDAEMTAVLGEPEKIAAVAKARSDADEFERLVERFREWRA